MAPGPDLGLQAGARVLPVAGECRPACRRCKNYARGLRNWPAYILAFTDVTCGILVADMSNVNDRTNILAACHETSQFCPDETLMEHTVEWWRKVMAEALRDARL